MNVVKVSTILIALLSYVMGGAAAAAAATAPADTATDVDATVSNNNDPSKQRTQGLRGLVGGNPRPQHLCDDEPIPDGGCPYGQEQFDCGVRYDRYCPYEVCRCRDLPKFRLERLFGDRKLQVDTTREDHLKVASTVTQNGHDWFDIVETTCPNGDQCYTITNVQTNDVVGCSTTVIDGGYPCQATQQASVDPNTSLWKFVPYFSECSNCYSIQQASTGRYITTWNERVVLGNYETAWKKIAEY